MSDALTEAMLDHPRERQKSENEPHAAWERSGARRNERHAAWERFSSSYDPPIRPPQNRPNHLF